MKVEKIRIQNFQCIRDSGDILFDDHITVLVGENEAGKSAILKALSYFNSGESFKDVDVSTMSGDIRQRLDSGELAKGSVEIVAVWITLSDKDRRTLALPEQLSSVSIFKIAKTLDSKLEVFTGDGEPLSEALVAAAPVELVPILEGVQKEIRNVYCGQVKRKESLDQFVFLQRHDGEPSQDNLILFPENVGDIWDDLRAGHWLQVTKIAEDPFGRNPRALNAGFKFDLETLLSALINVINAIRTKETDLSEAFEAFKDGFKKLPESHPLRDYISDQDVTSLEAYFARPSAKFDSSQIASAILWHLPRFVYVPTIEKVADSISLAELQSGALMESRALLATLLKMVGLRPDVAVAKDHAERMQILREKSRMISERLREYWFKKDMTLDFDFLNQDRDIGMAVDSAGSFDPPSRRSQGFSSFVSLFARLAQLASEQNIVVLLDDPAVNLHPVAQRKILPLLESQQYQIVLATHLPFLIDPEHLERIRVVKRTPAGSRVEQDWAKVEESLLPVWGSLMGSFTGKVWLLVEGKTDKEIYEALNQTCKESNREHLGPEIVIVPAGGSQLPYVAQALHERGIFFVAIVDGDKDGQDYKRRVVEICGLENQRRVVSLAELQLSQTNPSMEDLFSPEFKTRHNLRSRGLFQVVSDAYKDPEAFDEETLSAFEKVFSLIKRLY